MIAFLSHGWVFDTVTADGFHAVGAAVSVGVHVQDSVVAFLPCIEFSVSANHLAVGVAGRGGISVGSPGITHFSE